MQDRDTRVYGNRADKAIDQFTNGLTLTPAVAKQGSCFFIVGGLSRVNGGTREQPTKITQVSLIARTCQDLHSNRTADADVRVEQLLDAVTNRRAGVAKKFDPG